MVSLEDLRKKGWHLTQEGLQYCIDKLDGKPVTLDIVIQIALNTDLKDIGDTALPSTGRIESLPTSNGSVSSYVMQVQRVRNVSAPKDNEESGAAPPLLKVMLTDGRITLIGLDVHNRLNGLLTTRTPPGTKVALDCAKATFSEGYWLADSAACRHLGGRVSLLAESWRLRSDLRCGADGRGRRREAGAGPPPFVPFGSGKGAPSSAPAPSSVGANFKSMQLATCGGANSTTDGAADEDDGGEFAEQRRAMIDEARQQQKKAFATASHNQQLPQANKRQQQQQQQQQQHRQDADEKFDERSVDTIMNMGYSFTEALAALRHTRGDLAKAVDHILASQTAASARLRDPDRDDRGPAFAGADGSLAKPSAKLSLFDFVQGLPIAGIETAPQPQQQPAHSGHRFDQQNRRGPSANQRGPPPNQRNQRDEQDQRGPPSNQRNQRFEQDQRGPPPNQRNQRGEQDQRGPPPNQRNQRDEQDQRGPPPNQRNQRDEQDQRGPPPDQRNQRFEQDQRGPPPNQRNQRFEQDQRGPPPNQRNQRFEQDQRGPPPNQRHQRFEQDQRGPPPNQRNQRGEQDQRGPPPNQRNQRDEQDSRGPPNNQRNQRDEQDQRGPPPDQRNQRFEQDQRGPPPNQRNQRFEQDQRGPPPNQRNQRFEQDQRGPPPNQRNQRGEQDQRGPPPNQRDNDQGGRTQFDQQQQFRGPPPPGIQPRQSWCPQENDYCLARYVDNKYYSAYVLKLQRPERALIYWCDYNQQQSVLLTDLLPLRFDQPPPMPPQSLMTRSRSGVGGDGGGGGGREFYGRGARGY